jgi:prepilin-type N-terminal cleavage/methylation domain-containing protein
MPCQPFQRGDRRTGRSRAFTLMELMVVIAILAILAAILVPTLSHIQVITRTKETLARLHLIEGALQQYANEFDGAYPPSAGMKNLTGSQMLVVFLTGYAGDPNGDGVADQGAPPQYGDMDRDDGIDGFGWRVIPKTRPHGPYNSTQDMKTWETDAGQAHVPLSFADAFNNPIYYYVCYSAWDNGNLVYGYNPQDNSSSPAYVGLDQDNDGSTDLAAHKSPGGGLRGYRNDFLLLTRGSNGVWDDGADAFGGNEPTSGSLWDADRDPPGPKKGFDDITNFLANE